MKTNSPSPEDHLASLQLADEIYETLWDLINAPPHESSIVAQEARKLLDRHRDLANHLEGALS